MTSTWADTAFDKKYDLRSLFKSSNYLGYKNSQVRKYVQQLETCISAKKQKEIYLALKEQLTEDVLLPVLQGPPL